MENPTELGGNRTGLAVSPLHDELLVKMPTAAGLETQLIEPASLLMAGVRREYINDAEALGSVPPPMTLKGAAKAGAGAIMGRRMQALIDKIAERMAYERGGTRLYDAAMAKALALAEGTPVSVERMKEIRSQEAEHAELLRVALTTLGADPTAQTPGADLVGVQAMGLIQAVGDPRTSLAQTLSSLLAAELIDGASWALLVRLSRSMNQEELAERFEHASRQEAEHLETISQWYESMVTADAKLLS